MSVHQILEQLKQITNMERLAVIELCTRLIREDMIAAGHPPRNKRDLNQAAARRLKPSIDETYPLGRFVAIHDGRIVADAASLDELIARTAELGLSPHDGLAVQAGVNPPEYTTLFL